MNSSEPAPDANAAGSNDLVTVFTYASEFEAQTKAAVLHEAGIDAFVFGSVYGTLPLATKFLRVPLQVRAADVERARAVLVESKIEAASVDWDSVDLGERDDRLPLHKPGRMIWPARVGFVLAMFILVTFLAGFVWSLILIVFWVIRALF